MNIEKTRFVDFSERQFLSTVHNFYSDFFGEYTALVKHAKWHKFSWRGLTLMKDPMSLTIYQQMLQELKPKSILEFGAYNGGSALWMRDILDLVGVDCEIHTFDIDIERVQLSGERGIVVHHLDNNRIREYAREHHDFFASLPHPILAIEDSHENVAELLTVIDGYLQSGDYLVVEDTLSEWKHDLLAEFLEEHSYHVDSYYCDFWGDNNTWNVNSFLRKK